MADDIEVHDSPSRRRYEITVDGVLAGFAVYYLEAGRIVFIHTEIASAYEGRGLGSRLVRQSLDDVRRRGLRVVPLCPFYARFLRDHPEYHELTATATHHRAVLGDRDA